MATAASPSTSDAASAVGRPISLRIRTLDRQTYPITIPSDASVPQLKEIVAGATGVVFDRQRLIFRGRVLQNDQPIAAYSLEDGHVLHLVARAEPQPPAPAASNASATATPTTAAGPPAPGVGAVHSPGLPGGVPPDRIVMGARIVVPEGAEVSMPVLSTMITNFLQSVHTAAAAAPPSGAGGEAVTPTLPSGLPTLSNIPELEQASQRLRDAREVSERIRLRRQLRESRRQMREMGNQESRQTARNERGAPRQSGANAVPISARSLRASGAPPLPIAAHMLREDVDADLRDIARVLHDRPLDFQGTEATDLNVASDGDAAVLQAQWRQLLSDINRIAPRMELVPVALRNLPQRGQQGEDVSTTVDAAVDTLDTLQRIGQAASTMARFARGILVDAAPMPEVAAPPPGVFQTMQGSLSVMPISIDLIHHAPQGFHIQQPIGHGEANANATHTGSDHSPSNAPLGGMLQSILDRVTSGIRRHVSAHSQEPQASNNESASSTASSQARGDRSTVAGQTTVLPARSQTTWDLDGLWGSFTSSLPASVVLGIMRGDSMSLQRAFRVLCALVCDGRYAPHPSQWPLAHWSEQFLQQLRRALLQHSLPSPLLELVPNHDHSAFVDEVVVVLAQHLPALLLYVMQSSTPNSRPDDIARLSLELTHRIAQQFVARMHSYLGESFETLLRQVLEANGVESDLAAYVIQSFVRWANPTSGRRRPREAATITSDDAPQVKRPRTE